MPLLLVFALNSSIKISFLEVPQFELRLRAWHFQNAFEERLEAQAEAMSNWFGNQIESK